MEHIHEIGTKSIKTQSYSKYKFSTGSAAQLTGIKDRIE